MPAPGGQASRMSATAPPGRVSVPRDRENDYTPRGRDPAPHVPGGAHGRVAGARRPATRSTPAALPGNVEHFTGVAQVPIGLAGPLLVNGEHAQGEFYVPLATAEGTLVASYNRGMRLLHEAGGVTATVIDDRMQRAPAFLFAERARGARVRRRGSTSTSTRSRPRPRRRRAPGRLQDIEQLLGEPHPLHALQLHDGRRRRAEPHRQGDRGGLRVDRRPTTGAIEHFFLESNFATDKKSSQVNMLHTRGKRVIAEATIPDELFRRIMHSTAS